MVDADRLRIVFRVNGVTFVMPVADLLAIRGVGEDALAPQGQPSEPFQLGSLTYREAETRLYDLAALFELEEASVCEEGPLLVFAGSDSPWAVRVDQVDGVVDATSFEFHDLPTYLFRDESAPYRQVALSDGQLLISVDSRQIDQAWHRG